MQRLLTISFLLFLVALVSAKHTLHVDNVLPNFGETVLVSGPFKADSLDIALIDVAELTVQSAGGIDITSNIDLVLNGAAVDASGPGVYNLTTGSNFTITSATTTQIVGGDVNLNADNQLSIRSLGEFRFASLGAFNFSAGAADLTGESLDVNSATGGFYVTSNTLTTSSPSLSLGGMSVANFTGSSVLLEADQNIKMKSARLHMATDNLVMESLRTNLLLEGYLFLEVLADNFRVRAKGSGQFEAANGDLEFLNVNDVNMRGNQDMITQVQDSLRYSASGDIRIQSGGDVRIAADSDALFYSDSEANINGASSISSIGRHFVSKSGSGDISMRVSAGPFNATSSDYTRVYSEGLLSFSSSDDVSVSGLQGIALRAERGQLYINSPPTGNVGGGTVDFTSEKSLFFTGNYVDINTGSATLDAQDVRFETADAARSAVQNWDIATQAIFTLDNDFLLGSSSVQVLSDDDLVISAGQDAVFVANENSGSALRIYNNAGYTDVATDSIRHLGNQIDVAVTTSVTIDADEDVDFRARDQLTVDGDVITFNSPDVTYDTAFSNTIQGINSISLTAATESISMSGGRFTFDATNTFTADFDDEITMAASNLDFDADLEARYVTETAEYNADRYIIMNGDMSYSYPAVVINGNLIAGSPPGTDINIISPGVGFSGPLSVTAYDILYDIKNTVSFSPFSFTATSGEELPITFTAEDDLDVYGDDIRFDTAKGDLDNEVAFLAGSRLTLSTAEVFEVQADNDISFNSPDITIDAPDAARLTAYDVDIRSVNGFDLDVDNTAVFNATGNTRFIAQDGNLELTFDGATIRSGNELYLRSNQQMFWTAADDLDLLGSREITFEGGDQSITSENVLIESTNEIDIQGFDGVTLSALDDLSLTGNTLLEVRSQEFSTDAGETNTLESDDIILTTEQEEGPIYFQQTNPDGSNTVTGSTIRYQSNDELITTIEENWTASSLGDFLMQTASEDAGMLFYSRSNTDVTADQDISVTVRDGALDGKDVRWQSSTSALFEAGNGLTMTVNGFEYDPNFDQQVGMLYRAESGDITYDSGLDTLVNGKRGLRWESLDQNIDHTTDTGDIDMEGQQLVIRSADDLLQTTNTGDFLIDLSEYAIWQAGDDTSVFAGADLRLEAGNDIDIITDSGYIEFQYRGTVSQDYIADSLVAEGDAAFSWTIGGDFDTVSGSFVNFADADLSVSAGNDMTVTTTRDTFFVSSLNNDASFIAGTDLTATSQGKMEYYAGRDIVWDSTTGTSAYDALDITFTSAGSITTESTTDTTFTSAADLKITADNRVDFETSGTIQVGGPAVDSSIISVAAGGDRTDFGVYIATDDFITFTTNADLTETVGQFVVDSEGAVYTGTRIVIDARGADSLGEDVTFESLQGTVSLTSGTKTDLEGNDVRYEYDTTLSFDSANILTIKAATIVDMEALGAMNVKAATWETSAGTYLYASRGDTLVDASDNIRFSNTQQVTGNVQRDIAFEATDATGTVSFTTAGANSPITFRTQNVNSEFAIELDGATPTTFDAVQKTTITTVDAQSFGSDNNIELNAADDYTITSDDNIFYDARTGDLSINGLGSFGSGSRIQISSGGNLIVNSQTTTTLTATNDQVAYLPDESLTFAAYRNTETLDAFTTMTVDLTDDVIGEFDEDFTFMAANALFQGKTVDMTYNGIFAEEGIGARFTGSDNVIGSAGRRFLLTGDNVNFQGSDVQIGATNAGIFNTLGGMSFNATEVSTDIKVTTTGAVPTSGTATFTATQLLSITTTGNEPGVGYIRMQANGFSDGTEYAWFDSTVDPVDNYSIGFVAQQDDIAVSIEDGRFIVENLNTAEVTPGPAGNLLMQANGSDESGYGVTVDTTDLTISSGDNVALRAENIYFNELVSDVYARPDNRPLTSPYGTTLFRPTIQSIHDQTYTSYGQNKAGNGIELTTDVPFGGITFNVGNVQFDSGNDLEIVSEQVNAFESQYDTNILSRRSIHISGNGHAVDRNSVSILAVAPGAEAPSVEFNAENDILLEASQRLVGELEGEFDMRGWRTFIDGGSIHLESGATTTFTSPARVRVIAEGEISLEAENALNVNSGDGTITMTTTASFDGFGDIYFGDPESVSGGAVNLATTTPANFVLDAVVTDVTSQNSLVIPPVGDATVTGCPAGGNGMYFTTGPPRLHFCVGGNDRVITFYNNP